MDNFEKLRELFLIEEKDAIKCSEIAKNSNKYKLIISGSASKDIFIENLKIREYIKIDNINQVEFKNIHFKNDKNIMLFILYLFSTNNNEYNFDDFYKMFLNDNFNENLTLNINIRIIFDNCKFEFHKEDIIFQNIIFGEKVIFENCNFFKHLKFSNIDFKKELVLNKCNCIGIEFSNVEFNDFPNLQINDNNKKNILFKNLSLKMQVNLYKSKFQNINTIEFEDVVFDNVVNFVDSKIHSICTYNFSFQNVEFMKNVSFANIKDSYNIKFFEVKFYSDVEFDINLKRIYKGEYRGLYFEDNLPIIELSGFTIYGKLKFKDIKFNHLQVYFHNLTLETKLSLQDMLLVDKNICLIDKRDKNIYCNVIYIYECKFNDATSFSDSIFQNIIVINNCEFNKRISMFNNEYQKEFAFAGNIVNENAVFMKSIFYSFTNFSSSVFEKAVSFNIVHFMKIPNLYQTIIGSSVSFNITGVEINEYTLNDIRQEIFSYKTPSPKTVIDGFRHFLRLFKDTYIKINNLLDANKYKILELYVKEIELSYRLEKHKKNIENIKKLTIKERFDRWFLKLNRATSDHHTDFLKILLFTLSVIGGYFMINFGLSFDEKTISNIYDFTDVWLVIYCFGVVIFLLCLGYEFLFVLKGFSKDKGWLIFTFLAICLLSLRLAYSFNVSEFSVFLPMIFIGILAMLFILLANNVKYTFISFAAVGFIGILCNPSIITPFLGAFSEDARNHYLYKAIDELDSQKALDLSRQILAKEPTSELNAKKILKDYKDELKSSDLLYKAPELKRAVAIDGGVSRLNIAYYLVLAFCIFALQKTMRKNSIIPS